MSWKMLDDASGIYEFVDMLRTLGLDLEKKWSMKAWARGHGWIGKISKPKNMR